MGRLNKNGTILSVRTLDGLTIQTNNINLAAGLDQRSVARLEAALDELLDHRLAKAIGRKGQIFEVTAAGYDYAESADI